MSTIIEQATNLRATMQQAGRHLPDAEAFAAPITFFDSWSGAGIAYVIGDKRRDSDGKLYKCLQAHTSQPDWTPNAAVSLWVRIDDPAIEWPEIRNPIPAENPYMVGDGVTFNGQHYTSLINNNVWSPTGYPAGWQLVT